MNSYTLHSGHRIRYFVASNGESFRKLLKAIQEWSKTIDQRNIISMSTGINAEGDYTAEVLYLE